MMKKNKIKSFFVIALLAPFVLVGCQSTNQQVQIVEKARVVIPPEELFKCPELKNYPNPATLTNREVAEIITTLVKNNQVCANNIEAIKRYLYEARDDAENR